MTIERAGEPRGRLPSVGRHGRCPKSHLDFWGERELLAEMRFEPLKFVDFQGGEGWPAVGAALLQAIGSRDCSP